MAGGCELEGTFNNLPDELVGGGALAGLSERSNGGHRNGTLSIVTGEPLRISASVTPGK